MCFNLPYSLKIVIQFFPMKFKCIMLHYMGFLMFFRFIYLFFCTKSLVYYVLIIFCQNTLKIINVKFHLSLWKFTKRKYFQEIEILFFITFWHLKCGVSKNTFLLTEIVGVVILKLAVKMIGQFVSPWLLRRSSVIHSSSHRKIEFLYFIIKKML